MGVQVFVYLGPCARCRIERVPATVRGCVKDGCRSARRQVYSDLQQFCNSCGSPIGKFEIPNKSERVDWHKLFPFAGDERLSSLVDMTGDEDKAEFRMFVPNTMGNPTKLGLSYPTGDAWHDTLPAGAIADALAWFERAYAAEIEKLRGAYGPGNVEVVFAYFNGAR